MYVLRVIRTRRKIQYMYINIIYMYRSVNKQYTNIHSSGWHIARSRTLHRLWKSRLRYLWIYIYRYIFYIILATWLQLNNILHVSRTRMTCWCYIRDSRYSHRSCRSKTTFTFPPENDISCVHVSTYL